MATKSDRVYQLDPATIAADANIRFAITDADSQEMQTSIAEYGSVHTPVEVYELDEADKNGHLYGLLVGFRRLGAVIALNAAGADMTLPALVVPKPDSDLARLKRQISENVDRKSMSPMDQARAISELLESGLTNVEARSMFKRAGGKKGEMVPMSNSWLNTTLSFLTLPKTMQAKIHAGLIGWSAAQELVKVDPDKRAEVLEKAEKVREEGLAKEAKEDAKFTEAESKLTTLNTEITETQKALELAQAEVEISEKAREEKETDSTKAYKAWQKAKGEDQKPAKEKLGAAAADFKAADKRWDDAKKALDKLKTKASKATETAEEMKERLAAARRANTGATAKKPGRGKGEAVSASDVTKAAAAAGVATGVVKLTAADMRKTVEDLMLAGTYEKVTLIGAAFKRCFDGVGTPGMLMKELAVITGELKGKMPTAVVAPKPDAEALPPSTVVRPRTPAKK